MSDLKQTGRFLRLECLERGTEHGFSIYEFSVFPHTSSRPNLQQELKLEESTQGASTRKVSYRPQFHFTARSGYIDPNGLFFYDGVYHMFFQHWGMGRRAWGHATSKDLLHWTEHADALQPQDGFQAFSGCAVVDTNNTSGLHEGQHPPIVALFTAWGNGQHLAYSTDGGCSWKRYGQVLALPSDAKKSFPLSARDPMVIWHEPTERLVMILYQNFDQSPTGKAFGFFTSPNMRDWTYASQLPGFYVCPDLFQLPIDGELNAHRWVILDWDRTECKYSIGQFDGKKFTTETGPLKLVYGAGHHGATQTWKLATGDPPRLIQIVNLWHGKFPGEPFENQMSVPLELSLRRTPQGLRLCRKPIVEVASLYRAPKELAPFSLESGKSKVVPTKTRSFAVEAELSIAEDSELELKILGNPLTIRPDSVTFAGITGELPGTTVKSLQILADVTSVELFVNDGELVMLLLVDPPARAVPIELTARGKGPVTCSALRLHRVASTLHATRDKQESHRGYAASAIPPKRCRPGITSVLWHRMEVALMFDHDKLDAYRLAVEYVADSFDCHRWIAQIASVPRSSDTGIPCKLYGPLPCQIPVQIPIVFGALHASEDIPRRSTDERSTDERGARNYQRRRCLRWL